MNETLKEHVSRRLVERIVKIVICAVVGGFGYYVEFEKGVVMALVGFAVAFGVCWWAYSILSNNRAYAKFISLYKKEMIETALQGSYVFEEMQFEYDCGINEKAVDESGLIGANKFFRIVILVENTVAYLLYRRMYAMYGEKEVDMY